MEVSKEEMPISLNNKIICESKKILNDMDIKAYWKRI